MTFYGWLRLSGYIIALFILAIVLTLGFDDTTRILSAAALDVLVLLALATVLFVYLFTRRDRAPARTTLVRVSEPDVAVARLRGPSANHEAA